MSRPFRVRTIALLALFAAAGCQDYNFNPVGKCLIQPGNKRETLSDLSTADILFIVDDSGSMAGEQQKLAANFQVFIDNLDRTNAQRVANSLEPIDFHIAVTTTSIFFNESRNESRCRSDCTGATGNVCCESSGQPLLQPRSCASGASACGPLTGTTCRTDCNGLLGEPFCCNAAGAAPTADTMACTNVGARCGTLQQHYDFSSSCDRGVGVDGWPWPKGEFVSWSDAAGTTVNPRVLHFDKQLYTGGANRQGYTADRLKEFFTGGGATQGNVIVGTCGSGEEQGLEAARLAVQKAIAGQQKDTFTLTGGAAWTPATRSASAEAEWPHPNSKLVLVFVGDEDDCSSPAETSEAVVWLPFPPNQDTCVDQNKGETTKQVAVSQIVDYFFTLGRPIGAAFIFPATQTQCSGDTCLVGGLCCASDCPGSTGVCTNNATCGGQSPGYRLLDAANAFRNKGADVVTGSICDPQFGLILDAIAEIVKPPSGLVLPTQPAADVVTVVRIADRNGQTRKTCRGPAPDALTAAEAGAQGYDWWFTEDQKTIEPFTVSKFIHINHDTAQCEANPGETYSADYLGRIPAAGCWTKPGMASPEESCAASLGGRSADWTCFAGVAAGDVCVMPTEAARGTCICGGVTKNCAAGRL